MIVILHARSQRATAEQINRDLDAAFRNAVPIALADASTPGRWPSDVSWDDLLLIVYDGVPFPDPGNDYIQDYLDARNGVGPLLPVALDSLMRRPPSSASSVKALEFDAAAGGPDGRLAKRTGAILGLRLQQRDTRIFISYRASDGTQIAQQIEAHLNKLGYPVWRDEARELDGETKILPGSPVQSEIDNALEGASVVLLLDTPQAPHSPWIKHEVDTANSQLLPILPLCFRSRTETKKGPRFRSLFDLQRWVSLTLNDSPAAPPLTDAELALIVTEMEAYVCEIFRRKCRVPFLVEKEFVSRSYTWSILDARLLMCESVRSHSVRLSTRVLSHCSIFEQVHGPAMNVFSNFLTRTERPNHALYIYDGELIPEPELKEIIESSPADSGVVILHHQELAALIESNFTTFTP